MSSTSAGCETFHSSGHSPAREAADHERQPEAAVEQQRSFGDEGGEVHAGSVAERGLAGRSDLGRARPRRACPAPRLSPRPRPRARGARPRGPAARGRRAGPRRCRAATGRGRAERCGGRPRLRPGGGRLVQRRPEVEDQGDLAAHGADRPGVRAGHRVALAELEQRAAHDLLVHLGELAAHGGASLGQGRRQHGDAARQPLPGLEGHDQAAAAAPAVQHRLQLARPARQIADEAEAVAVEAGGHQRREHRRRPRQHGEVEALGDGAHDQAHAGILHAGHAGVGDQGHVLAVAQAAQHLLGLLRLVVLEEAGHLGVDVEVAEELARVTRVFGGDEVHRAQRVEHARRHVPEIADRRGADVQHAAHPFRKRSMKMTSMSRPARRACRRARRRS